MSGRRWQSPRQRHFTRAASSASHLADALPVPAARHGGAEVKSKGWEPCSLDVNLSGGFTKMLGVSRMGFLSQACFQALLLITQQSVFTVDGWRVSLLELLPDKMKPKGG